MDVDNTQYFDKHLVQKEKILSMLIDIYTSLREKGYEPHDQVGGYSRDEIIEVLLKSFLSQAGTVE